MVSTEYNNNGKKLENIHGPKHSVVKNFFCLLYDLDFFFLYISRVQFDLQKRIYIIFILVSVSVCVCDWKCIHFADKIIYYTAVNNWMSICDWPSWGSIKCARLIYIVIRFDVFMATARTVTILILRNKLNYWLFRILLKMYR